MRDPYHRLGCRRTDHPQVGRRELLHPGALTLLGMSQSDLLRLESLAAGTPKSPRAKSVIFIFQSGSPSQHETFDPKPEAPDTIRGEYSSIATATAELRVCEYLARRANLCVKLEFVNKTRRLNRAAKRARCAFICRGFAGFDGPVINEVRR